MNDLDLDHRLRQLASGAGAGADDGSPADLQGRAASLRDRALDRLARRRRHRVILTAVPVVVLIGLAALAITRDDDGESVTTGPAGTGSTTAPMSTTPDPDPGSHSLGTGSGVTITVAPATGLADGDLVEVRISGIEILESPLLVMCAGDVTAETAASDCDLRPLEQEDGGVSPNVVEGIETVTVRRVITLPRESADPNEPAPFDCATEPVGCVIAVGEATIPARGAFFPITFAPVVEDPTPAVDLVPAVARTADQPVAVSATGLRPNSMYRIMQCETAADGVCDETAWPTARSGADGTLAIEVTALPAIYGWKGRADCTAVPCQLVVTDDSASRFAAADLSFAPGIEAPVPVLEISPAGPYHDDQVVTLTGRGFPPGLDIGGQIGQCPTGKDTAKEERCVRPALGKGPVADGGTFSFDIRLTDNLIFTGTCLGEPGCHLAWVLPHGPTVATAPLTFVA